MKNIFSFTILGIAMISLLTFSVTNEIFADTDNNGRNNGKKLANGCDDGNPQKNNPNCKNSSGIDSDNDGLTDTEEEAIGTDPYNADTDNDTLLDGSDACPLLPNENWINGNPDHDKDGKIDSKDNSPCG